MMIHPTTSLTNLLRRLGPRTSRVCIYIYVFTYKTTHIKALYIYTYTYIYIYLFIASLSHTKQFLPLQKKLVHLQIICTEQFQVAEVAGGGGLGRRGGTLVFIAWLQKRVFLRKSKTKYFKDHMDLSENSG